MTAGRINQIRSSASPPSSSVTGSSPPPRGGVGGSPVILRGGSPSPEAHPHRPPVTGAVTGVPRRCSVPSPDRCRRLCVHRCSASFPFRLVCSRCWSDTTHSMVRSLPDAHSQGPEGVCVWCWGAARRRAPQNSCAPFTGLLSRCVAHSLRVWHADTAASGVFFPSRLRAWRTDADVVTTWLRAGGGGREREREGNGGGTVCCRCAGGPRCASGVCAHIDAARWALGGPGTNSVEPNVGLAPRHTDPPSVLRNILQLRHFSAPPLRLDDSHSGSHRTDHRQTPCCWVVITDCTRLLASWPPRGNPRSLSTALHNWSDRTTPWARWPLLVWLDCSCGLGVARVGVDGWSGGIRGSPAKPSCPPQGPGGPRGGIASRARGPREGASSRRWLDARRGHCRLCLWLVSRGVHVRGGPEARRPVSTAVPLLLLLLLLLHFTTAVTTWGPWPSPSSSLLGVSRPTALERSIEHHPRPTQGHDGFGSFRCTSSTRRPR